MSGESNNQVILRGRISSVLPPRTLPSGDEVATFRVVVERPKRTRHGSKQTVDTFACDAWTASTRRIVQRLEVGQQVVVQGRLRRQFSRNASAPTSRVSVDLATVTRADRELGGRD